MNFKRFLYVGPIAVSLLALSSVSQAHPVTGELFYTRYSGSPNVRSVDFDYDGSAFNLSGVTDIGTTNGADGIAGNPQNSDLLLIGGQSNSNISTISKSTGTDTAYSSPADVYHLEVPSDDIVLGSGIPGQLVRHPIASDGALGLGDLITLTGDDTELTQVITTPSGYFYTRSGSGGHGDFGTLTFDTGDPATASAAETDQIRSDLAAAHGGVYDPFTGTIIVMGDGHITQLDLTGSTLADIAISGMNFDQGTVDGEGHLFAADNGGNLTFIDYASASGGSGVSHLINGSGAFQSTQYLDSYLDDIAPLVGEGSTTTTTEVPAPGILGVFGIGLAAIGLLTRRRRHAA